jgi:hypothetical protein
MENLSGFGCSRTKSMIKLVILMIRIKISATKKRLRKIKAKL